MTLPGFEYPHQLQPGCWQERACRRALENLEHDDLMDAAAYDRRRAERDGWQTAYWDGR